MEPNFYSNKNESISTEEITELRKSIGWDGLKERFDRGLEKSYCHFSVRDNDKLIGFARVVSDGRLYAFIVDVMIHPTYQHKGLGKRLIQSIINDLKKEDIRLIQLVFSPELEEFYRNCGFSILKAGSILNK